MSSKQQPQNYQHNNIYELPYRKLQQFSANNSFLSVELQTNSLARMQASYENQLKWACFNNFFYQRRQQLIYTAYMMAQSNTRQGKLLLNQQNVNNYFTPKQNFSNNMIHVSNQRYNSYCKPKHKNIRTTKVRNNITARTNSDIQSKSYYEEKISSSKEANQQKHKDPLNTTNSTLENDASKSNKKSIENTKAMVADFSNKYNICSLDNYTRNNPKQIPSFSKSSDVISISIPETYKSSNYQNLSLEN